MQKNIQLSENIFIQDLGSGFSYVNFDRTIENIADPITGQYIGTIPVAGTQYRIKNPATYDRIVNEVVKEHFPNGADQAALRKGIIDNQNTDFISFNTFVEQIKLKCKNEGL